MTKGVYTDIIYQIKTRLEANITEYKVYLGNKNMVLTQDQQKVIIINIEGIEEQYGRALQKRNKDAVMSVTISCMKALVPDSDNKLYESDTTGLLPFIEEVLDALNTDGATENPQLVNSAESMGISIGGLETTNDRAWFDINVTVSTKPFTINNRQNK
jgi:hypothetical protein